MNSERLFIFLAVAKNLSYTKAAEALYISQPAVSNHVKALEKELGTQLFNRLGNSIQLTETGKITYDYAVQMERLVQDLQYDVDQMQESFSGSLRIGASSTISQYVIPSVIAAFNKRYPDISLSLTSGNTNEINKKLEQDQIHIGITEGVQKVNTFSYMSFISDEIVLVSYKKNASVPGIINAEELQKIPLILREVGSGTRDVFKKAVGKMGLTLDDLCIKMTLGSTESIKSYLEHTDAAGVFSVRAIRKNENAFYTISRLTDPITRQYQFIQKQGAHLKSAGHFVRFARLHYKL